MSLSEIVAIIAQLVFLEGILSLDNAAVLGAMVSVLPQHEPVPWPPRLQTFGRRYGRLLGGQQAAALKVGVLGAYVGRALMLVLAATIIRNPWLRLLGAAYLLKLAISHLALDRQQRVNHPGEATSLSGKGFWGVVVMVELTDLAFSIDSVVVAVALSSRLWLVMAGVAVGIIMMRFAAQAFVVLIEREPVLVPAAYTLVLIIGLELLTSDLTALAGHPIHIDAVTRFLASIFAIATALAYAHSPRLYQLLHPFVHGVRYALGVLNQVFDAFLAPFRVMVEGLVIMARALV